MYPEPQLRAFVEEQFVPVRAHVKEQPDEFKRLGKRFDAHWTPTTVVVDPSGTERHRIEGFLPAEDFRAQLALGLAHSAFGQDDFQEAERRFRRVIERHPQTDAAAEAQYWAGVSRYKASGDASALADTARQFKERYRETSWAKKASVWS